jgi:hypothetical protein
VPGFRRVVRGAVARLQLLDGEMVDDPRHGAAPRLRPGGLPPAAHAETHKCSEVISRRSYKWCIR